MEEWDEAQIVAISSNSLLSDNNAEYSQKATLQSFGFTSNRNISPTKSWPTNKIKKSINYYVQLIKNQSANN